MRLNAKLLLLVFLALPMARAQVPEPGAAPIDGATVAPPAVLKTIELEWDAVENAGGYEVKLTPADGGKSMQFTTLENHISEQVPVGNYDLQVRAKSSDGSDYSPWSEKMPFAVAAKELTPIHPEDGATLDGHAEAKQTVEFKWTPVDKIKLYTLIVWNEERKDKPWIFTTKETSKKIDVPPAQVYHWQVKFDSADDVEYQQQLKTFSFTLLGAGLLKPEINTKPPHPIVALNWKPTPDAKEYLVKLYFRYLDVKKWKPVREEKMSLTEIKLAKLKPGAYKLEVIATAPRHMPSEAGVFEFFIKPTEEELSRALQQAAK
jgi:hypothetical protein